MTAGLRAHGSEWRSRSDPAPALPPSHHDRLTRPTVADVEYLAAANLNLATGGQLVVDKVYDLPETDEVAAVVAAGYLLPKRADGSYEREVPETRRCCGG